MLWFNEAKDFGYILAESGERVYVHRSAFVEGHAPVGRCKGRPVQFTPVPHGDGWSALAVSLPAADDQRRATRRQTGPRARH
jgi:cold shock CspA family protein